MLVLSPNYSLLLEGLFHLLWLMLKMVNARLDVAASGFLGCGYQILRYIFNPNASFYRCSSLSSLYCRLEKKQKKYEQRICEVEIGCFAPLVFLTFGGMSTICNIFFTSVLAIKKDVTYIVMSWV